jgi:hypothetical protein
MPWLSCFIGGVYQENHRPAASLTDFIRNGVSSNKGVLIADILFLYSVIKYLGVCSLNLYTQLYTEFSHPLFFK